MFFGGTKNIISILASILGMALIIQLNMQHSKACHTDLCNYIRENTKDSVAIAAVQEPWVAGNGSIKKFPERNCIFERNLEYKAQHNWPLAALYFTNGINITPVPAFIDRHMATGIWATKDCAIKQIMVTSVYMESN